MRELNPDIDPEPPLYTVLVDFDGDDIIRVGTGWLDTGISSDTRERWSDLCNGPYRVKSLPEGHTYDPDAPRHIKITKIERNRIHGDECVAIHTDRGTHSIPFELTTAVTMISGFAEDGPRTILKVELPEAIDLSQDRP